MNENYKSSSDKDLINYYEDISLSNINNNLSNFISIISESMKRTINNEISDYDIELFNKFIDKKSLNIENNYKALYAFALYSIYQKKKNHKLHVIYINKFLLSDFYEKLKPLYDFLNIKAEINLNYDDMIEDKDNIKTKTEIYKGDIIFANLEEFLHDYVINIDIDKISDRIDFKFETAFIFDIDNILYDRYEHTFKINGYNLKKNELKLKDFFKQYKTILGISPGLFFEKLSQAKKYNLKIENLPDKNKLLEKNKEIKNLYFLNKQEKIKNIAQTAKELLTKNKTIIIDANDDYDLRLLKEYLNDNKIKYDIINDFKISNKKIIAQMLIEKKVTILANLTDIYIKPKLGGDYEYITKLKTSSYGIKQNTNFYREKYKSELKKQKEKAELTKQNIIKNNSIYLFFTSKYLEIKNEYLTINNYKEFIQNENITIYNCPEDELYRKFHLNNLSILHSPMNEKNESLFKIINLYTFYLRKILLKRIIMEKNKYLEYTVIDE